MARAAAIMNGLSRKQWVALVLYALVTPLSFPQELSFGLVFDFGGALAWFGPAALIVGIHGLTPKRAARAAFLASLAGHAILFHWFYVMTVEYSGVPAWLGVFAPLIPSFYVSVFSALFAWLWTRIRGVTHSPIWLGAMIWVAVDWARCHFLGGFPWATLGYALHQDWPLLVWTRWAGVYALSFFVAAAGIAIGRVLIRRDSDSKRAMGIALTVVALAHGVGLVIEPIQFDSSATVRIAAVQGSIDQGEKWDAERKNKIINTYLRLSHEAADQGANWIVWPETAIPGFVEADQELYSQIVELARSRNVTLIVGGAGVEFDRVTRRPSDYFDSAFVFDPDGRLQSRYDKSHLVPFGEFDPFAGIFGMFFQSLARGLATTDITSGAGPRAVMIDAMPMTDRSLQVGIPICYELLFPHEVRRFAAEGAGVLLAITNDAWYGRTGAPHQFLAMTALRAAENGRFVVRAANTGISAIINAQGHVLERSSLFEEAVIVADIPIAKQTSPTLYARVGDVFAGFCVLVTCGLLAHDERARRTLA